MTNADNTVWLTYNGEIYNHLELRKELARSCGHKFLTHYDTETLLYAYVEWGEGCLSRLRGMFAFGIVDLRKQTIFLARDHFDVKPLVYFINEKGAAFASEIQALQKLPAMSSTIDVNALDQFLRLQYIHFPFICIQGC